MLDRQLMILVNQFVQERGRRPTRGEIVIRHAIHQHGLPRLSEHVSSAAPADAVLSSRADGLAQPTLPRADGEHAFDAEGASSGGVDVLTCDHASEF